MNIWMNPLDGLSTKDRLCRVVAATARLESEGQSPTQRTIAGEIDCSEQWSLIDPDLRFAVKGYADGRPISDRRPLLEASGPDGRKARGDRVYRVTDAGHEYLTLCRD